MKKFKLLTLSLTALMAFGLVSCGAVEADDDTVAPKTETPTTQNQNTEAPAADTTSAQGGEAATSEAPTSAYDWNTITDKTNLFVAVFDKYVETADIDGNYTKTNADKIIADYIATLPADTDVVIGVIHYASSSVADFGAEINNDTRIGVVIGSGANIFTTGLIEIKTQYTLNSDGAIDNSKGEKAALLDTIVTAQTGRQAMLNKDDQKAIDFYNYLTGKSYSMNVVIENSQKVTGVSLAAEEDKAVFTINGSYVGYTEEEFKALTWDYYFVNPDEAPAKTNVEGTFTVDADKQTYKLEIDVTSLANATYVVYFAEADGTDGDAAALMETSSKEITVGEKVYTLGNQESSGYLTLTVADAPETPVDPAEALNKTSLYNIAVFGRYVSLEIDAAMETAFNAYLTELGYTGSVNYIYFDDADYHKVADFVSGIQDSTVAVNAVIGGGNNISSTAGSSGDTLSGEKTSLSIGGDSTRNLFILDSSNNSAIDEAFVTWATSEAGQTVLNPTAEATA